MDDNYCICCGRNIPEGRQICESCEKFKYSNEVNFLKRELRKTESNLSQAKSRNNSADELRALLYRKHMLKSIIKVLSEVRYE